PGPILELPPPKVVSRRTAPFLSSDWPRLPARRPAPSTNGSNEMFGVSGGEYRPGRRQKGYLSNPELRHFSDRFPPGPESVHRSVPAARFVRGVPGRGP